MALLSWGFGAKNNVYFARFTERLDARIAKSFALRSNMAGISKYKFSPSANSMHHTCRTTSLVG